MNDLDWTKLGWHHADIATSWALGALAYLALIALVTWAVVTLSRPLITWTSHRLRVWRLRRDARRSGRPVAPLWDGALP